MSKAHVTVGPGTLSGTIAAIPSKSVAHRVIQLAALTEGETAITCPVTSADIEATIRCVRSLGAVVDKTPDGLRVIGAPEAFAQGMGRGRKTLDCGESGSTLRFLLPVVAALGGHHELVGHGRLAQRPLSPLYEELVSHGAALSEQGVFPLVVEGKLSGGTFTLPGNVSSQYVSGLLMAAPLVTKPFRIEVSEPVESLPYIELTIRALAAFGVSVRKVHELHDSEPFLAFEIGEDPLVSPSELQVEGDWSNAAFWLAAGALSAKGVSATGLDLASAQGDRAIVAALDSMGARVREADGTVSVAAGALRGVTLDVSDIPDLVPPLAAVAAHATGLTRLEHAGRLRLKESDRLATVSVAVNALGGEAHVEGDDLVICGGAISGGTVDAANDHRIAMMTAVMATAATSPVTVVDSSCVAKSYPAFWTDFAALGGILLQPGNLT